MEFGSLKLIIFPCLLPGMLFLSGCNSRPVPGAGFTEIYLSEPFNYSEHEYSGLAWHGNQLILLPQYPDGSVMVLQRDRIEKYLKEDNQSALTPENIPINDAGLENLIPGFEGFEAIAFNGDEAYLMIESEAGADLSGYIIKGRFVSPPEGIVLDHSTLKRIDTPVDLDNMSYESIVYRSNVLYPLFEANGANVNPHPFAPVISKDLETLGQTGLEPLEYRITDATEPDDRGKFWVINYLWTGEIELLKPGNDRFEVPGSRMEINSNIERLVEYQITDDGIKLTGTAPIWITDPKAGISNNWEGIARFGTSGFLIITDRYSRTILAYVERPGK